MEKKATGKPIRDFFIHNFDLHREKEDEIEAIESIRRGVEFKGMNLWVLIFATFIASLGLNTNSSAVIIGAMLISPLMGPIMGFGLGLGINDFELIKRSFRNFATATIFSVITSSLYFLISPISDAQSELLARTQPTVYDVLIAFFGGLAFLTISPSIYLSYNLIKASYFNRQALQFINAELNFPDTQILNREITDTKDKREIKVVLIGEPVSDELIENAQSKMAKYGLYHTQLLVQQGFGTERQDIDQLKSLLMQDLYTNSEELLKKQSSTIDSLQQQISQFKNSQTISRKIMPEMKVLFPDIEEMACSRTTAVDATNLKEDSVLLVYLKTKAPISQKEQDKIRAWIASRASTCDTLNY